MKQRNLERLLPLLMLLYCSCVYAQVDVTASVTVGGSGKKSKKPDASNVVLWLTPLEGSVRPLPSAAPSHPRLVQKNKSFEPHILVVPVGTQVEFPNRDPFFHNVFSLFEGKRFD